MITFIISIFLIMTPNTFYSKSITHQFFNKASDSYLKGNYNNTLRYGLSGLNETFQELMDKTYKFSPFIQLSKNSNITYSMDIYNNTFHFNGELQYDFFYLNMVLTNSMIYSYEEINYYLTLIDGIKYFDNPDDNIEIHILKDYGKYLWNKKEQKAYYVYEFHYKKINSTIEQMPGILLTVQFPVINNKLSPNSILLDIVENTKWKKIQNLFKSY